MVARPLSRKADIPGLAALQQQFATNLDFADQISVDLLLRFTRDGFDALSPLPTWRMFPATKQPRFRRGRSGRKRSGLTKASGQVASIPSVARWKKT